MLEEERGQGLGRQWGGQQHGGVEQGEEKLGRR